MNSEGRLDESELRRQLRSLSDGEWLEQLAFPGRGKPEVEEELFRRIREREKISFAEFMEVALYLPGHGYYASGLPAGRAGDFVTSPEVHPAFGALIARALVCFWRALGSPRAFTVLELGAGSGRLCRDVLSRLREESPDGYRAIAYSLNDLGIRATESQRELLREESEQGKVNWVDPRQDASIEGCILAHELLDALPVHRLLFKDGALRELYVAAQDGELVEEDGEPSVPALAKSVAKSGLVLAEGQRFEVSLAAQGWMREQARRLKRGFLVVIDYGDEAQALYSAARREGTVRAYYQHALAEGPCLRPGYQDITASVDFTGIRRSGEEAGLQTLGLLRQEDFLKLLGIERWLERLRKSKLETGQKAANLALMESLLAPGGLGEMKFLLQSRSVDQRTFDEIFPPADGWRPGRTPLLATAAGWERA